MPDPILPQALGARLAEFLAAKKTGQLSLNINEGRIESFDLREHGRVVARPTPCADDAIRAR